MSDSLHTMRFYFEEAPIFKEEDRHSIDITKRFNSWVNENTLATIITELVYCLMAMTYNKEVIKEVMMDVAEELSV